MHKCASIFLTHLNEANFFISFHYLPLVRTTAARCSPAVKVTNIFFSTVWPNSIRLHAEVVQTLWKQPICYTCDGCRLKGEQWYILTPSPLCTAIMSIPQRAPFLSLSPTHSHQSTTYTHTHTLHHAHIQVPHSCRWHSLHPEVQEVSPLRINSVNRMSRSAHTVSRVITAAGSSQLYFTFLKER